MFLILTVSVGCELCVNPQGGYMYVSSCIIYNFYCCKAIVWFPWAECPCILVSRTPELGEW